MLCDKCRDIFLQPRKLTYGTYYPWGHTSKSFHAARGAGCHLCNLVWENISYEEVDEKTARNFPEDCTYGFKVMDPDWARHGRGAKWLVQSYGDDGDIDTAAAISRILCEEGNETIKYIAKLLATESDELLEKPAGFWLVLDFYCRGPRIVLPIEVVRDEIEDLAQVNLENQQSTGAVETLQIASAWLQNCVDNHPQCRPTFEDEHWLPTRLVSLGTLEEPHLRVVTTSTFKDRVNYAALSHRWGDAANYCLTSHLLSSYEIQIPVDRVSTTMKDSFHATRSIGLQYMWVDSICIIQDDKEDWSRESATMSKVYGLATCTVGAACDGDGDDGCFAVRNQYRVRPLKVPNPFAKKPNLSFYIRSKYLNEIYKREVKDSIWYGRGWVFQERTLTPRLMIFGKTQVIWACQKIQAAETWPCGRTSDDFIDRFESFETEKSRLRSLLDKDKNFPSWDTTWSDFISNYTKANLTRISDRLVALQGLASHIEFATGRSYCAGLWLDETLPLSLLWTAEPPILARFKEYRAPTWSWASIDGQVQLRGKSNGDSTLRKMFDLRKTITLPLQEQSGTTIPLVALMISGQLLPATLISQKGKGVQLIRRLSTPIEDLNSVSNQPTAVGLGRTAENDLGSLNLESPVANRDFGPEAAQSKRDKNQLLSSLLTAWDQIRSALERITESKLFLCIIIVLLVLFALILLCLCLLIWICTIFPFLIWHIIGPVIAECCPTIPFHINCWYNQGGCYVPNFLQLPTWRPGTPEVPESMKVDLRATFTCDIPLGRNVNMDVVCLPILSWISVDIEYEGLLLRPVERLPNCYERVGTFKTSYYLLAQHLKQENIVLV